MTIIGWIIFGAIVGAIGKLLMPGRDPGGIVVTILLGIAGSLVGGFLARSLFGGGGESNGAGWIGSIIGVMILLFAYRMLAGRRSV
ncbi:MAG: GlsB/YeaQ/YmgE family stress response membrane protein [Gemmatimonadota bacterium]|nr:GlsB/YeaQ/YmgE family stress response membrane protein [Gemmatimonadota bacterium]